MPDQNNLISRKTQEHGFHLARLCAKFLFLFFCVGCVFSVLGKSTNDFLAWRDHLSRNLLERSYLPLIVVALYSLSVNSKNSEGYKRRVWQRLTILCVILSVLYTFSALNSGHRMYSHLNTSYTPIKTIEESFSLIESRANQIESTKEAKDLLKNIKSNTEESAIIKADDDIDKLRDEIKKVQKNRILRQYEKSEKAFHSEIRNKRFESTRYLIYSIMFIFFYLNLVIFFNRLYKSS